jgi:hypothetical protein
MTELEKTMRAREYIRKLADGIDPLTDTELPADSAYNNARISRCMFFVSEILDKVIANDGEIGGKAGGKQKKKIVYVPEQEDIARLKPHADSLAMTKFIQHLQQQLGEERGTISRAPIVDWLVQNELLKEFTTSKGTRRFASDNGLAVGIQNFDVTGKNGDYTAVYYNTAAQQIIIDALMEIFCEV